MITATYPPRCSPPGTAADSAAASAVPGTAGCAASPGAPVSPRTAPPATGRGDVR
jgi:hypothetical protein